METKMSDFDGREFSTNFATRLNHAIANYDALLSWVEYASESTTIPADATEEFYVFAHEIGLELMWAVRSYEQGDANFEKKRYDPAPVVCLARELGESFSLSALVQSPEDAVNLPIMSWDRLIELYTDDIKKWLAQFVEAVSFEANDEAEVSV